MSKLPKTEQVAVRITQEEKERLAAYCDKHDITISHLMRQALRKFMEDNKI